MSRAPARVGVVGAGIVGLAVARAVQTSRPATAVTVLDKEPGVALHQSGRNSGVVHAGVYYPPGSAKARLCLRGRGLLRELCERHGIAYEACGKLVVATGPGELDRLAELERRARLNGVPGLRRVGPAEMAEIEPHATGVAGLHSPATAIVDYAEVARVLAAEVVGAGGEVRLGWPVTAIARRGAEVVVGSGREEAVVDRLVVCAGLQADLVARMAGDGHDPVILAFRGEYHRLRPGREHLVRALVYPVPDPAYPFLGVHFTRRVRGGVDVGPNAVLALAREGYRRAGFDAGELARIAATPGFWRLARRHWRVGLEELRTSLSTAAFVDRARRYIPELGVRDVEPAPAGVRAQALARDGSLVDDFVLGGDETVVTVRNAPSPAATSALAIAEEIVARLLGMAQQGRGP